MRQFWICLGALLLAACSGGATDPAHNVVRYLQARANADAAGMRALTCAAREAEVDRLAQSFAGRDAKLENVRCTFDAASATATCSGHIVASYGAERQAFPVGKYALVQEDGVWRVCGETR